jgi:hypothetical protein
MGVFIGAIIGFITGGLFGFIICALLVATEDDKEGRQ